MNGTRSELAAADWGISLGKFEVSNSRAEKTEGTWKKFMPNRVVFPLSRAVEWKYPLDEKKKPHGKPTPWVLFSADESIAAIAGSGRCSNYEASPASPSRQKLPTARMSACLVRSTGYLAQLNHSSRPSRHSPAKPHSS